MTEPVVIEKEDGLCVVTINRPHRRNAVDAVTARALASAFLAFEQEEAMDVAILTGAGDTFCAGADLKALAAGEAPNPMVPVSRDPLDAHAPMGPSRLQLSKPVIAAIAGHAVAGGLELAVWCDLRVAEEDAVLGVFCRRWGVPLIDGGTVRLPRLIGLGRALDLILTGRAVGAQEALAMGLVNRVVPKGQALAAAKKLAKEIAQFPRECMRADRLSTYRQWSLPFDEALAFEFDNARFLVDRGFAKDGAGRFLERSASSRTTKGQDRST